MKCDSDGITGEAPTNKPLGLLFHIPHIHWCPSKKKTAIPGTDRPVLAIDLELATQASLLVRSARPTELEAVLSSAVPFSDPIESTVVMSPDSARNTAPRPLAGLRVLEVGQLIAGPFAGTLLAYFGAEVIKIEPPGSGDPLRTWRIVDQGTSWWWWAQSRNKRSVTVDLHHPEGRGIVRALAGHADVLIENFRPGQMEKWDLGPDELRRANPALIYTRVSGYGQTGPNAAKPGFASVCEGFGGLRYINGFPGESPVRPNLSLGDTLAGLHAALGVLIAYIHRQHGGTGQVVDVAIYEAVFNMLESVVPEFSGAGVVRQPSGSTLTGIVPSNIYRCRDQQMLIIGANTDSMFKRLMSVIDRPDLAADASCADNTGRVENQTRIDTAIEAWTLQHEASAALDILERAEIAAGPIYRVDDMFRDPHYRAREMFETVRANDRELTIPAMAPKLSATPGGTEWPGPALGADTEQVLADLLGLTPDAIAALRAQGAI